MVVRGPNQLNKSKHRLNGSFRPCITLVGSSYLVRERLDIVLFNLRNIDFSRGPRAFSADCFARNVAWASKYSFIKYWTSFWVHTVLIRPLDAAEV